MCFYWSFWHFFAIIVQRPTVQAASSQRHWNCSILLLRHPACPFHRLLWQQIQQLKNIKTSVLVTSKYSHITYTSISSLIGLHTYSDILWSAIDHQHIFEAAQNSETDWGQLQGHWRLQQDLAHILEIQMGMAQTRPSDLWVQMWPQVHYLALLWYCCRVRPYLDLEHSARNYIWSFRDAIRKLCECCSKVT